MGNMKADEFGLAAKLVQIRQEMVAVALSGVKVIPDQKDTDLDGRDMILCSQHVVDVQVVQRWIRELNGILGIEEDEAG